VTDAMKKVAKALIEAKIRSDIGAEVRSITEKQQAIIRAEAAINSEIGRWTGTDVGTGHTVPIVRDGKQVGTLPGTILSGSAAAKIAALSLLDPKAEVDRKRAASNRVADAARALIDALGDMTWADRAGLEMRFGAFSENALRGDQLSLQERVIREIGIVESSIIAAKALITKVEKQVQDLKGPKSGRGRPKNEAAHAVARELALLYAKVTGKRPTYSESPDGLSGAFTPALRRVFDALGWSATALKGPAEAAVAAVTEADLQYERIGLGGLFSSLPRT